MIERTLDQWREIREQAHDIKHSSVITAMKDEMRGRMHTAMTVLTDPGSIDLAIRIAQGQYIAHKRDIMILEDLIRMATKVGKSARKSKETL
jgi:hypothetical protein